MHSLFLLCLCFLTFGLINCSEYTKNEKVIILTESNFTEIIQSENYVFVEFYANGCSACLKVAPTWQKLPSVLKAQGIDVVIAEINGPENQELMERYGVLSTPSFVMFKKNISEPEYYRGARHTEAFVYLLKEVIGMKDLGSPAVQLEDLGELNKYIFWRGNPRGKMEPCLVGFFPTKDSQEYQVFLKVIATYIDFFRIVETSTKNAEVFSLPVDTPSLVLYRQYDEGKTVYDGKWEVEEIKKTMTSLLVPMIERVDHENLRGITADVGAGYLLHIFVTEEVYENNYAEFKDELYEQVVYPKIEKGHLKRGNFTIAFTNGVKYNNWLKVFKLENNTLPCAAAYFPKTEKRYAYGSFLFKDKYVETGDFIDKIDLNLIPPVEEEKSEGQKIIDMMNPEPEL